MKNKKMERAKKAVSSAKASLAAEGMHLTEEEEILIQNRLAGKMTEAEFKKKALALIHGKG